MSPGQKESGFSAQVIELARRCNWATAHFRTVQVRRQDGSTYFATPVAADGEGWPDLALCRERMLYRELKTDDGDLDPLQKWWGQRLTAAGCDFAVWRPRDWPLIERVLTKGRFDAEIAKLPLPPVNTKRIKRLAARRAARGQPGML